MGCGQSSEAQSDEDRSRRSRLLSKVVEIPQIPVGEEVPEEAQLRLNPPPEIEIPPEANIASFILLSQKQHKEIVDHFLQSKNASEKKKEERQAVYEKRQEQTDSLITKLATTVDAISARSDSLIRSLSEQQAAREKEHEEQRAARKKEHEEKRAAREKEYEEKRAARKKRQEQTDSLITTLATTVDAISARSDSLIRSLSEQQAAREKKYEEQQAAREKRQEEEKKERDEWSAALFNTLTERWDKTMREHINQTLEISAEMQRNYVSWRSKEESSVLQPLQAKLKEKKIKIRQLKEILSTFKPAKESEGSANFENFKEQMIQRQEADRAFMRNLFSEMVHGRKLRGEQGEEDSAEASKQH